MSDEFSVGIAQILTEGMHSYWDVQFAVHTFEQKVQEIANRVLSENLDKFRGAFRVPEIPGSSRWAVQDACEEGRVILGAGYNWTSAKGHEANVLFGIGWRPASGEMPREGFAGIEIRAASQSKMRPICRALRLQSTASPADGVVIYDWPEHLRFVAYSTLLNATEDGVKRQLTSVLDCFVAWCSRAGGLNDVLYPPRQQGEPGEGT
jgi:hypothetical protein